jgi:hypothetical protein
MANGGRGITICQEWLDSFETFLRDMGPKPDASLTLQRIDNDKPYAEWNCKWATWDEQLENRPARGPRTMKAAKTEMQCLECGELFTANRIDQQFCTGRCKSKNFRRIQKEKMNLFERFIDKLPLEDLFA